MRKPRRIARPRRNGTRAPKGARVPKRLHALAGVDPRLLPAGTLYPCDDPRVGTMIPGGRSTPGGRVVACASRGPGVRGHDLFVGGAALSGRQIAGARRYAEGESRRAQRRAARAASAPSPRKRSRGAGVFGPGAVEPRRTLGFGPGSPEIPYVPTFGPGAPEPLVPRPVLAKAETVVAKAEGAVVELMDARERSRRGNTARKKKGAINVADQQEVKAERALDRAVDVVSALAAEAPATAEALRVRLARSASQLTKRRDGDAYTVERPPSVPLDRPKRDTATGRTFGKAAPLNCDASPVRNCAEWRTALAYFERLLPFVPESARGTRQRILDLRAWLEGRLTDAEFGSNDYPGERWGAEDRAFGVGPVEAAILNAARGIGYESRPESVKSAALEAIGVVELAIAESSGKPVDFRPLLAAVGLDEHTTEADSTLAPFPAPTAEEATAAVLEWVRTHREGHELFPGATAHFTSARDWPALWREGLRGELPAMIGKATANLLGLRAELYRALLPYAKRPKRLAWDSPTSRLYDRLREARWGLQPLLTIFVAQQAGLANPAAVVEQEFRAKAEALRAQYEGLSRGHVERFGPGVAAARKAIQRAAERGTEALDAAMRSASVLRPAAARAGRDEYLLRLSKQIARLEDFGRDAEGTKSAIYGLASLARFDLRLDHIDPPFTTDGAYGRPLRLAIEEHLALPLARLAYEALEAMRGAANGRRNDTYEVSAARGSKDLLGAAWVYSDAEAVGIFAKARDESAFALWRTMVEPYDAWAREFDLSPNSRFLRQLRRPGER